MGRDPLRGATSASVLRASHDTGTGCPVDSAALRGAHCFSLPQAYIFYERVPPAPGFSLRSESILLYAPLGLFSPPLQPIGIYLLPFTRAGTFVGGLDEVLS